MMRDDSPCIDVSSETLKRTLAPRRADPEKPGGMISEEALQEKKKALEGGLSVDIRGGSTRNISVPRMSARVSPVRLQPRARNPPGRASMCA